MFKDFISLSTNYDAIYFKFYYKSFFGKVTSHDPPGALAMNNQKSTQNTTMEILLTKNFYSSLRFVIDLRLPFSTELNYINSHPLHFNLRRGFCLFISVTNT